MSEKSSWDSSIRNIVIVQPSELQRLCPSCNVISTPVFVKHQSTALLVIRDYVRMVLNLIKFPHVVNEVVSNCEQKKYVFKQKQNQKQS